MSKNDYFAIVYKILSYLKYCYDEDKVVNMEIFNADTFNVSNEKFYRTLVMLNDQDGYICGIKTVLTKDGTLVTGLNRVQITTKGFEYLSENSMMKKAYKVFKEVRDWLPII